jgi:hypothetical protein
MSSATLTKIEKAQQILEVKKFKLLEGMMTGDNPSDIIKASQVLNQIQTRETGDRKSFLFDPQAFNASFGFKDKPTALSYNMLKSMAKTPIINAIIRTRINQIASFAEPQSDRFGIGYKIKKKKNFEGEDQNEELTKEERKEVEEIIKFLENCGDGQSWEADDFDGFVRKIIRDSLTYDQMCFEVIHNRKGVPCEFYAVDSSTMRIADSYDDDNYQAGQTSNRKKIKGYYPNYVQVYQQQVKAEFYPWEMCFGVRNPDTSIYLNGYGVSELEELTATVTAMLWGDEYNRRFFKQGSAPKGILRVSGMLNESKVQEFKQMWNSQMRGVYNAHKTPILEADKAEWVDLQKSNREMEYNKYQQYLLTLACAVFAMDPSEVNFSQGGNSGQKSLFEGNNEARLKWSRDKGLIPILKFLQKRLNKFLVSQFYKGKYEFSFEGLTGLTPQEEVDLDTKLSKVSKTVNEVRRSHGLKDLQGGDILLDGVYTNALQMEKQNQMQEQQGGGEEGQESMEEQNPILVPEEEETNPIEKSLQLFLNNLNKED